MKNMMAVFALSGLLLTACKKETVQTTEVAPDGTTVVTTTTQTSIGDSFESRMAKAEADLKTAKDKLAEATKNGDEKAKLAAKKTADEAVTAWEKLKLEVREATSETKESLQEAKEDVKEGYNKTLEKAKAD